MTDSYLMTDEPRDRIGLDDLNKHLAFLVKNNASDITLQTDEKIYAEIYGVLYQTTRRKLSKTEVSLLLNGIYGPNGTTQLASGLDLDTYYEYRPNRVERYRFRVNATACLVEGYTGIQITLRSIPTTPPLLSDMKLPTNIIENLAPDSGAVYVTGATGSGKSTLLASIIRNFAENPNCNRKILTYESPIEFVYDSINKTSCIVSQSEIPRHLPSFDEGIRNALRRKPRLILVGECRDTVTIDALLEASLTGHPVYTTVHSNGVAETVRRLVNSFTEEERNSKILDIIETMRLIIWQQLVPTVDNKRTPLREYLVFDQSLRSQLFALQPNDVSIKVRSLVKEKGQTMYHDAMAKHKDGIISDATLNHIKRYTDGQDADHNLKSS